MNSMLLVGIILLIVFLVGTTSVKALNIPDIIVYILLGIVINLTSWDGEKEVIKQIGDMGLVLLFFMLGMRYSIKQLIENGKKIWKAGILDIILGVGITSVIAYLFGLSLISSLFVGALVFATSSSIAVKVMEHHQIIDKEESKFILGLLIFEDLIAPIILTIILGLNGEGLSAGKSVLLFGKIIALIFVAFIMTKLVRHFQQKIKLIIEEDVFIFLVVGMALSYGGFAVYLGLSEVIGAFLGGIMLAEIKWKEKIRKKILPVQNLLLPFYFLYFGLTIQFTLNIPNITLLATILIWSFIFKILVGYYGGRWFGIEKKYAWGAGMLLTQRGEFSIIIAGLATGTMQVFSSIYVLIAALVGFVISHLAVKLIKS